MAVSTASTKVVVLLSGGLDSSSCLAFYRVAGFDPVALFCDYGQASAAPEHEAARAVASHYGSSLLRFETRPGPAVGGEIPGRNLFLLAAGLMVVHPSPNLIAIGIHAGTGYRDCTPSFLEEVNRLFHLYTDGATVAVAPFATWSKRQIYEYARLHEEPISLTYSCEDGLPHPCGRCRSCLDRIVLGAV